MKVLAGKVCVVTGASGMGADAALRFAAEGAAVTVLSKDEEQCVALDLPYIAVDLTDEAATSAAFAQVCAQHGRIDATYAVAGASGRRMGDGPVHEMSLAAWQGTFDLNAVPSFLTAREAVRAMMNQPMGDTGIRGSIVLMSSVLAYSPAPLFTTHAYAATKSAVVGLTRAMAATYASYGIRVNALAAGLVRTPMSARAASDPDSVSFASGKQALTSGFLDASDVTEAALFLCSDASRGITGQVIAVDGGWTVL
jgi:NAD(P)-dependent dehydrogenase (short-subunit alcohol dehydrogenase family)